MKNIIFFGLLFLAVPCFSAQITAVTMSSGALQSGTTGFHVSSGTVRNFRASTVTVSGLLTSPAATITTLTPNTIVGNFITANDVSITNLAVSTMTLDGFGILPIMQFIQNKVTTSSSTIGTSFERTNLFQDIAPKLNTSQVIIYVGFQVSVGAGNTCDFTILRDGSNLLSAQGFVRLASNYSGHVSYMYLDAPATTSSVIYQLGFKTGAAGCTIESANETGNIIVAELAQ